MVRFIHAADIHLDSPRAGLERDPEAPSEEIRQAPRQAFRELVDLTLREAVDFLLIAGDLYDGDWRDFHTGLFFIEQMGRLRDAGIPVFLIAGNHDAANVMTRTLKLPENVHFFDNQQPETRVLEEIGVAVHGQSFATKAVTDNLSLKYPAARSGYLNVGLLHTCATGNDDHERYAPCSLSDLVRKEYHYWALGHVHQRAEIQPKGDVPIVFSGNLQGRHIREAGAKGCYLVTANDRYEMTLDFRPVDVLRWELLKVDACGADHPDEIVLRARAQLQAALTAAEQRPVAVRIQLSGACRAHEKWGAEPRRWRSELDAMVRDLGAGRAWLEKVERQTSLPVDRDRSSEAEGALAELLAFADGFRAPEKQADLLRGLEPLRKKLPSELTEGAESLGWERPEGLTALVEDARHLLAARLRGQGGAR